MKKLFLVFAFVSVAALTACNSAETTEPEATEEATEEVIEEAPVEVIEEVQIEEATEEVEVTEEVAN